MSDPMTFADFLNDFNEKYMKFQQDFIDACGDIVDMLNDAAGSIGEFFDDILPGGGTVDKAIDKWNDEINPALGQAFTEIQTKVNEAVNDLVGSPLDLQTWAEAYAGAKSDLYKQRSFGETAAAVSGKWSGPAFEKYDVVDTEQNDALLALANALTEGGKLTSAAANKILTLWRKLIYEFASFGSDILSILSSATNASNIISFEVPTILEACAKVWQKVVNIVDLLMEFMISQGTTDTINWIALAEGATGLPGNQWPPISEAASDTMNDSDNWNVA